MRREPRAKSSGASWPLLLRLLARPQTSAGSEEQVCFKGMPERDHSRSKQVCSSFLHECFVTFKLLLKALSSDLKCQAPHSPTLLPSPAFCAGFLQVSSQACQLGHTVCHLLLCTPESLENQSCPEAHASLGMRELMLLRETLKKKMCIFERGRESVSAIHWSTPQVPAMAGSWGQEPGTQFMFPLWVAGMQLLGPLPAAA